MLMFLFLALFLQELYPIHSRNVEEDTCFHKATNSQGICLLLINCTYAYEGVLNQVEFQVCRLAQTAPIVCCPKHTIPSLSTTTLSPISTTDTIDKLVPTTISSKKCLEYSKIVKQDQCKINLGTSTGNQSSAILGEFPHMAAILFAAINDTDDRTYECYGALISEKFVLTLVKCFWLKKIPIEVHLGLVSVKSTSSPNVQKFKIKGSWFKSSLSDLGLVEIDGVVRFDQYVRPICLGDDVGWHNGKPVIASWTSQSRDWQKTSVKAVDIANCFFEYPKISFSEGNLTGREICVEIESVTALFPGSPLHIRRNDVDCMYTLVGLVKIKQSQLYRNVLARVQPYREWIESVVWPNETSSKNLTKHPILSLFVGQTIFFDKN